MANGDEFDPKQTAVFEDLLGQPPVLINPNRIAIMLELQGASAMDYPQLKHDLGDISDGALASNLRTLAKAGFIEIKHEPVDSKQRTTYLITPKGIDTIDTLFRVLSILREEFLES